MGLPSFGLGVYVFEQTGKAVAMVLVTLLAFMPSLLLSAVAGVLVGNVGKIIRTGSGRGTGFVIFIAGVLVCVTSVILYNIKSVKKLGTKGLMRKTPTRHRDGGCVFS